MLDPALIQRIRAIFLHREPRVTIAEAAGMLGWSRGEMNAAIANGEIEVVETCSGTRVPLRELAEIALQRWSLVTVERALGRQAGLILPPGLRTRRFGVRLPRYQLVALQVLAADGGESVEAMVLRMIEALVELHYERLVDIIPGLAEAMAWPQAEASWLCGAERDVRLC
jgi:hypothetical protein